MPHFYSNGPLVRSQGNGDDINENRVETRIRFACSEERRPKLGRFAACSAAMHQTYRVSALHNAPHARAAPSATNDHKVRIPRKHERGRGDDLSERGY